MLQHLHEDVLPQREDIIHGPVQHQSGRAVVQKHQEEKGQHILLHLGLHRESARIDRSGQKVHHRHRDGQHIDGEPTDLQQRVRRAQIGDGAEGNILQYL